MNRRNFLQLAAGALASSMYAPAIVIAKPKDPMKRIGLTTVTFRSRFQATKFKDYPIQNELTLKDIPKFYADRFKIHNLEFWSLHFESKSPSYLKELRKKIEETKSTLINIQVDDRNSFNLSNTDESRRQVSLTCAKQWIDVAAAIGSKAVRINTGQGSIETCISSFKQINSYALKKGVIFLIENHGGISSNPDQHIKIIKAVANRNCRTLPDFGNYPNKIRYEGLKKIMPYAHQISAKTMHFNDKMEHITFDFGRCMRIAKEAGFKGIYSIEQWDPSQKPEDYEKITDWAIEQIKQYV
ncbi:MAG: sugar phosphate isomerase/epimerase family protein [Planctomycetota bacterium]|jgi:sugar phosphate isomerase/epimerase